MTIVPRYDFPPGTEIKLLNRPMAVTGIQENGYSMVGLDDGVATVVPFGQFVEYFKLPGAKINVAKAATGDRLRNRLGGFTSVKALKSQEQQALGQFHVAMCQAVDIFISRCREDDPNYVATVRKLSAEATRKFIAAQTELLLGEPVYVAPPRGGERMKGRVLYKGRTIYDYYQRYKKVGANESCAAAVIPLLHKRGNRNSRLPWKLRHLMTQAWEETGLDLKGPSVANVHGKLETLINTENKKRVLNDLSAFVVPSQKTLRRHLDSLLTPTEYSIAVEGPRETRNKKGRGSTDVRALMIGELCGMDEQKMSLVTSAKEGGFWHTLSDEDKDAYEAADNYIRKRLQIIVLFDVASRMPLAWVIAENPNADATLALLRMATRDKTREQILYGCKNDAVEACGIQYLRNDNGSGLRNQAVISALMGLGTSNIISRTYNSTDRAQDERFFGTVQSNFFKLMPGYTGGRPGDVPGYDAIKNGVVDVGMLYGMLTRYLVDEYPFQKNYGVGMFGRRPWDVYQEINETRLQTAVSDLNGRRIHLGWEVIATPSDEGVRVFGSIWFNSDELQLAMEDNHHKGKVKVFVDPDDLNIATVLMPGVPEPIEVLIQTTVFADMTLGEVLQLVAEYRREDPEVTEIYNDRLMEVRTQRYADISSIGVEHDLPRSYSTIEECKAMASAVFAGARMARPKKLAGTTSPDAVTNLDPGEGVFSLGGELSVIDGGPDEVPVPSGKNVSEPGSSENPPPNLSQDPDLGEAPAPKKSKARAPKGQSMKLARPTNLKELK